MSLCQRAVLNLLRVGNKFVGLAMQILKPLHFSSTSFQIFLLLQSASSTLHFRLPSWTTPDGAKGVLNGESLSLPAPGVNVSNFLFIIQTQIFLRLSYLQIGG